MSDSKHLFMVDTEKFLSDYARYCELKLMIGASTSAKIRVAAELEKLLRPLQLYLPGVSGYAEGAAPKDEERAALRLCLPELVLTVPDLAGGRGVAVLLACLDRHDCWQRCIDNERGAYALAEAILRYIECYSDDSAIDKAMRPFVQKLFNAWTENQSSLRKLPSVEQACIQLFGSAWCEIVRTEQLPTKSLVDLAVAHRPPFRTGLCQAQSTLPSALLPYLDIAP